MSKLGKYMTGFKKQMSLSGYKPMLLFLLGWLGIGLVIRLVLMPFFAHRDIIHIYTRSYILLNNTDVPPGTGNFLSHLLHMAHLKLMLIFNPSLGTLFEVPEVFHATDYWDFYYNMSVPTYYNILGSQQGYGIITLLKMPYLFFDMVCALLILYMFKDEPQTGKRAFVFWMLNIPMIYSCYIFGRYETFAYVSLLLAVISLKKEKDLLAVFLVGVGYCLRTFPVLLLLPLLIITYKKFGRLVVKLALFALPVFVSEGIKAVYYTSPAGTAGVMGMTGIIKEAAKKILDMTEGLLNNDIVQNLFKWNIEIGQHKIYMIVCIYIVLLAALLLAKNRFKKKNELFAVFTGVLFSVIMAFSYWHPQYYAWASMAGIFILAYYDFNHNQTILLWIHMAVYLVFNLFFYSQGVSFMVAEGIISQPIFRLYDEEIVKNLIRSILTALLLVQSFALVAGYIKREGFKFKWAEN